MIVHFQTILKRSGGGVSVGEVKYSPGIWHIQDLFTLSRKSWMQTSTHSQDSQPDANNLGCKC